MVREPTSSVPLDAARASRLAVMNFLNEVALDHPKAISFASGRPAEAFFAIEQWMSRIDDFVAYYATSQGLSPQAAYNLLAQYGRTNGVIADLVAKQVANDERIACHGSQIVMTTGCQEAIALAVASLCTDENDVLLVRSPTYIGATGVADVQRVEIAAVSCADPGDLVAELRREVTALAARGKRARAFYLIAEFDNPTGTVLPVEVRREILTFCEHERIVILEDNPYGMFRFEGEPTEPLFSLDRSGCVVYLGTYSKTLCPALRVGFMIVPERLFGGADASRAFLDGVSRIKSFLTVNTSQIMQALVGGMLLAEGGTLQRIVQPPLAFYRDNRDAMLDSLAAELGSFAPAVRWNRPLGGFFLTLTLPFPFGRRELELCAREHGVLTMPLSFFALNDREANSVRLAYSNVAKDDVAEGVRRFATFVRDRVG